MLKVESVKETETDILDCRIDGETVFVPKDKANRHYQAVLEWEAEGNARQLYTLPAQKLQNITARQLRLALSKNKLLSQVEPALKAIPNDQAREEALIEWEYATEYQPNHPLVYIMMAEFGLSDDQFRTMWLEAMKI